MKKLFFSTICIFIIADASAQVHLGVHAGINFANVKTGYKEYEFSNTSTKRKPGIVIGLLAEIRISNSVIFRPELSFIQKGVKMSFMNSEFSAVQVKTREHTLNFIEMPLNFMYKLPWAGGRYHIGGGPLIAFGIGGSNKYEHDNPALSGSGDVKFDGKEQAAGENNVHLKPLDFGLNMNLMITLNNGFFISTGYGAGLNSLDINNQWNSYKTNGITLKLGYSFGGNKSDKKKPGKFK